jgi:hypothetical protein
MPEKIMGTEKMITFSVPNDSYAKLFPNPVKK